TYSFTPVNPVIDPLATSFDLDAGGKTDQFLTFIVPLSDVATMLAARGINGFTKDTQMRLVAATATQDNSLNEDLNGVVAGINSPSTWDLLGAFTQPYSFSGVAPAPEPSASYFFLTGGLALFLLRRKSSSPNANF